MVEICINQISLFQPQQPVDHIDNPNRQPILLNHFDRSVRQDHQATIPGMGNLGDGLEERSDLPIARFGITHILADLHQQLDSPVLLDDAIHFETVGGFAVVQFTATAEQFLDA